MAPIEKQQFRNQTDGYVGVVIIGPRGDDRGIPVEPGGTVWLSEPEQRLTANAPRDPAHNPFVPWTMQRSNPETGAVEEYQVTPLVPISEERFVPADLRYVPADTPPVAAAAEAELAARADEPSTVTAETRGAVERHQEVEQMGENAQPGTPPPPPPRAAAAAQAAQAQEEETAAAVDPAVGEETGAAQQPTAPPPTGEYQAGEEVGTPTAPQTAPPAPYTPPQE